MWQSQYVARELTQLAGREVSLVQISTQGDRDRVAALSALGGQGVFTREVQQAVLDGRADLAVHSLKDLPTVPVPGLILAAVPPRESRFDALLLPKSSQLVGKNSLMSLPQNSRVATGSPRRRSQLLYSRPDLMITEVRGNVETRLRKLDDGEFDALILAEAGLNRLGLSDRISQRLAPPHMFPAVGQGALGIECRSDDAATIALLSQISSPSTSAEAIAERACLFTLKAGCHAPVGIAVFAKAGPTGPIWQSAEAVVLSPDGTARIDATLESPTGEPIAIGLGLAEELLQRGAARWL